MSHQHGIFLDGLKNWFLNTERLHRDNWKVLFPIRFFLPLMCFSVWPVILTATVNEVWFGIFSHKGFNVLENIVLKIMYKQTVLTLIFYLKMVNRKTALWRKQERFFCCNFLYVQNNANNPAIWTHSINQTFLRYVMIYVIISSFTQEHTLTHIHTFFFSHHLISIWVLLHT